MVPRLEQGITVADVGCGFGASTVLLAAAYPNSTFVGFDYHDTSIAAARTRAGEAGVEANVTFEVAAATDFPGQYDLICLFDCLHDMGDPVGAARHIRQALRPGGSVLLIEPAGADRPRTTTTPSADCSTPAPPPCACPAHWPNTARPDSATKPAPPLTEILTEAGFTRTVATSTPINVVIDARP